MPTYIRVKDLANAATTPATDDFILLSGAANGARKISRADFLTAVAGFYTADPSTYKLATLDAGDKVLVSQLPSSAFSYKGTWAASTNTPTLANGTGTAGDTYYASDSGSVNFGAGSISFLAGDAVVYDGTIWQKVPDVVNLLDGKGTLDEAKTTLEIPDVGTAPNETPLNQHLGSLAYADADSVSAGTVSAETLTVDSNGSTQPTQSVVTNAGAEGSALELRNSAISADTATALTFTNSTIAGANYGKAKIAAVRTNEANGNTDVVISTSASGSLSEAVRIDSSQRVGINTPSPDFALDVAGDMGIDEKIYHNGDNNTYLQFNSDQFTVRTGGTDRLIVNNTAIQMGTGMGIDFGSGANSTISSYEIGTWTPTVGSITTGPTAGASAAYSGRYTRIGRMVYCSIDLDFDNAATSVAVDDRWTMTGLPFSVASELQTYTGAGSFIVYGSIGSGVNAFGTVGITETSDTVLFYVTHLDGTLGYEKNVRAIFSYETDA